MARLQKILMNIPGEILFVLSSLMKSTFFFHFAIPPKLSTRTQVSVYALTLSSLRFVCNISFVWYAVVRVNISSLGYISCSSSFCYPM
ncbi:hypothetical protein BO86DRAFT_36538 [Aspergillus japonicus CBS 114.51]|uniref:Uncharacterized protein n=1 Tax=Aspergillus japonicus CBS 114.51 TaxID=1448312 RepID=A0A8T8WJX4_ASPJA|nr:hypothetical protein BO86DRAFT_36538 [Aspergillus japonicus CBS 114.51]RAH76047.1 hypothetical protein BO86DRAFT_36538 [Aspergillus japonicus CBS 114.51]